MTNLLQSLMTQLKATVPQSTTILRPKTAVRLLLQNLFRGVQGEEELHVLVDILMAAFRRKCCTAAQIFELCSIIKHISEAAQISTDLYAKLTLLPMLGYGLWKLLEISSPDAHPLHGDFLELDRFFAEWIYAESEDHSGIIRLSWHLSRPLFLGNAAPNASGLSFSFLPLTGFLKRALEG